MAHIRTTLAALRSFSWREAYRAFLAGLKRVVPFALGIAAAFSGLALYSALSPPPTPMTVRQVNTAIAQAIASVTPPPAYSAQVYRAAQPSLVAIQTSGADESDPDQQGLGSGVVISARGEILTALHVVESAENIRVFFADGTETSAQIASSQPENDIAVLQPDRLPPVLAPAVLGNPRAVRVGDEAYAVGNPFGLYGSLSAGVVSGFNRSFQAEGSERSIEGLLQIDTAVNPGNSGGPLLNRYGQVIGIVIGVLNPTDQKFFVGIGFAVPITVAAGAAGAPQY